MTEKYYTYTTTCTPDTKKTLSNINHTRFTDIANENLPEKCIIESIKIDTYKTNPTITFTVQVSADLTRKMQPLYIRNALVDTLCVHIAKENIIKEESF